MSKQIYIFNPEHDLCIANGDENFVPPRSAVGFAKENIDLSEHLRRTNKQRRQIIPWGWNPSLKKRLVNEVLRARCESKSDFLTIFSTV